MTDQELLDMMNERFCVVGAWRSTRMSSTTTCVVYDTELGIRRSFTDIRNLFMNRTASNGRRLGHWWLEHPDRRQVDYREELGL